MLAGISRAPLARRLRELIARNQLFAGALAVGAVLRLLTMVAYPGALWFSGDSYVYVGAALRPQPDLSKTTGYSFFLRALLPLHSFTLVTGLQHLMGLAIAVMVYALARRAGVSKRWATAATLPVLLDGFEIEDEHMIMAEALFTFLVMLALLAILWRYRVSWPIALGAGLLVGYAVDVRSEGVPLLILFPAFLAYRAVRLGWKTWRHWLAAVALAVGCAAPVVGYAAWFHHYNGTYSLTNSEGFYLWGRVSSFAECSVIKPPANELAICPSGSPRNRTAPGDYIWHAPQVHDIPGGPVTAANDKLLRDFAIRAIEAQPFSYVKAVLKGLALAVEWPRQKYPDPGTVSYYNFQLKTQTIPNNHTWIARRYRLPGRGQLRPCRPEQVHRAARGPDRPVPEARLYLRAAVRAHHADGARRDRADHGPAGAAAPAGLVAAGRQHDALGYRRRASGVPDRGRRLRLPVPASRSSLRLPGRGPGLRPGPGPARAWAARPAAGRRAAGRPDPQCPRPGQLSRVS